MPNCAYGVLVVHSPFAGVVIQDVLRIFQLFITTHCNTYTVDFYISIFL